MTPLRDFRAELRHHFGYLETEFGFSEVSFSDQPSAFDNFQAVYSRTPFDIQITRDRSQVFVEIRRDAGPWYQKETLLKNLGVPMNRFPNYALGGSELWSGYDIENQSTDLRRYLEILLQPLPHAAQPGAPEDAPTSGAPRN